MRTNNHNKIIKWTLKEKGASTQKMLDSVILTKGKLEGKIDAFFQ